jgi:hypothetical protein
MALAARFDPKFPVELRTPPPRLVHRRQRYLGWLGLIPHTLIGLGMLVFCIGEPILLFGTRGIPGRVVDFKTVTSSKGAVSYHVTYLYSEDGQTVTDTSQVGHDEYAHLTRGDVLPVHAVNFFGHHFSELDRTPGDFARQRFFLWPFTLIWLGMISLFYLAPLRSKHLVRDGEPILGKVTGKDLSHNKNTTNYRLAYTFTPMGGQAVATRMLVRRQFYDQANVGDEVVIVFDPNKPKRSVIYQYCDYQAG